MSGKMKLALVVLAFMTPVSLSLLFSGLQVPSGTSLDANIAAQYQPRTNLNDADGDGLSNRDESLWRTDWQNPDSDGDGFKDGEEVLSGHDPSKPGPNDFLDVSQNVTERFSSLLLGSLITGAIQPDGSDNDVYLNQIADTVIGEYQQFTLTPRTVELDIVGNTSESFALYIEQMAPHWQETFPESIQLAENYLGMYGSVDAARTQALLNDEKHYKAMVTESTQLSAEYESLAQALQNISVPKAMANAHRNGILLLRTMSEQILRSSEHTTDPVGATLATTALASLVTRTSLAFIYDYVVSLRVAADAYINPPTITEESAL